MPDWHEEKSGRWVPSDPLDEPFGVLWSRLWSQRRNAGEPRLTALFRSWIDARAISRLAH